MTLRAISVERAPHLVGTLVGFSIKAIHAIHRAVRAVVHALCGLRGHDDVLHFERTRLSLRCLNCGRETTGWVIDAKPRVPRRRMAFPRAA